MSDRRYVASYYQKSENIRLGYVVLGHEFLNLNRPLVFINGITCAMYDWSTLADEVSKSRTVLLYDHRGVSSSSFRSGMEEITFPIMVEDLLDLLDHLGWSEVDIVGYSMGGMVLQQLLAEEKYYKRIKLPHAIFAVTSGGALRANPDAFATLANMAVIADTYTGDRSSLEFKGLLREGVEVFFDYEFCRAREDDMERYIDSYASGDRSAKVMMAQGAASVVDYQTLSHQFPETTKILVIHGTKDRLVPVSAADDYLRLPQSLPLRIGSGKGEVPDLEFGHTWYEYFTPQIWSDVINEFLAIENPS